MNETLIILRGCSGSGKTTFAKLLEQMYIGCSAVAADDFHYDEDGNYNFNIDNLPAAHKWCREEVEGLMALSRGVIIVHNTSTTEKEIKPYIDLAGQYGYDVVSLVVENRHNNENIHDVPAEVLQRQYNKLRSNLKLLP